jgi:hypothetical protein
MKMMKMNNLCKLFIIEMSSSSSSSSSSSDSDDDEITKQKKKDKRRAKIMRRQKRSELENIEEEKRKQQRLLEMKRRREYLEMKKKKEEYQRFLLERQRNPNKEPIVSMLATARNRISKSLSTRSKTAKKAWYNMSPPKPPSPIKIGERQNETPSIDDWRKMMGLSEPKSRSKVGKGGRRRRRTIKNSRQ